MAGPGSRSSRVVLEVVLALYRSWNERDLDGWVASFHPDAEWVNIPSGQMFRGAEGMRDNYVA